MREDMFPGNNPIHPKEEPKKDEQIPPKKKIQVIGPDGSVITADSIKDRNKIIESWDKQ